jgi:hypothetical protein
VEPIVGHDLIHRQQADLLESYFLAANGSSINFRTFEAILTDAFMWEDAWLRTDWFCPFWRFDSTGAVSSEVRVTEDGTERETEEGEQRVTEGE